MQDNQLLVLFDLAIRQIDLLLDRKSELIELIQYLQKFAKTAAEMDPDDADWNRSFFEAWVELELTYALAASEERAQLSAEEVRFVEDLSLKMRSMLQKKVAKLSLQA